MLIVHTKLAFNLIELIKLIEITGFRLFLPFFACFCLLLFIAPYCPKPNLSSEKNSRNCMNEVYWVGGKAKNFFEKDRRKSNFTGQCCTLMVIRYSVPNVVLVK